MSALVTATRANEAWGSGMDGDGHLERTTIEQECDLMVEALCRELDGIKNQLAWLTYHLSGSEGGLEEEEERVEDDEENRERGSQPRTQSSRLSGTRSSTDTPHTAMKKMEKAKEELEKVARAAQAEKERWKYYMGVVDKAEDEQKAIHDKYLRLMQTHVEQQRQRVQENTVRLCRKMRKRERKEKALRLQKKPNHFRSQLDNDTAFLSKLYHSTFYEIVGVEHQLKKAGKLRGLADLKEFWELMLGPPSPPPPPSHPSLISQQLATPTTRRHHPFNEEEEEEEESHHASWALTALPPEHDRVVCKSGRQQSASCKLHAGSEPVPLQLPQVRPIADVLHQDLPAIQFTSHKQKSRAHRDRIQAVEDGRHRTRHMYQQARANEIAMRKLLPDISSLGLEDVGGDPPQNSTNPLQNFQADGSIRYRDSVKNEKGSITEKAPSLTRSRMKKRSSQSKRLSPHSPSQAVSSKTSDVPDFTDEKPLKGHAKERGELPPLSMNSLLESGNVMVSKGKSVLWSNYR